MSMDVPDALDLKLQCVLERSTSLFIGSFLDAVASGLSVIEERRFFIRLIRQLAFTDR